MFGWTKKSRDTDPPLSEADRRDLQLSSYLDGDLSAADRDALEAQLRDQPQLADALDGMRQIRDTLATLETVRAPRSFVLEAPPAPATRRAGSGRFELVARFGAVAAAVAFAAVLFGDVSGPALTNTTSDSSAGGAALERATDLATEQAQPVAALAEASEGTDDGEPEVAAGGSAPVEAASGATVEESTLVPEGTSSALVAPGVATTSPSGATASVETYSDDAGPRSGSNDATDGAASDDALDEPADASAPSDSVTEDLPRPAPDTDAPQTSGTDDQAPTLATQVQESSGAATTQQLAPIDDELSVLQADDDGISTLAIGLGGLAAILTFASSLLWWQRRKQTTDPA